MDRFGCHSVVKASVRRRERAPRVVSLRWPHRRTHRASAGPATVAAFVAHEAYRGFRAATITRRRAAIRYAHRLADLKPPRFRARARHAPRHSPHRRGSPARKAPVLAEAARAMALSAPDGLKVSATMRCYCWASLARFAVPNSWRSTSLTSRKPRKIGRAHV